MCYKVCRLFPASLYKALRRCRRRGHVTRASSAATNTRALLHKLTILGTICGNYRSLGDVNRFANAAQDAARHLIAILIRRHCLHRIPARNCRLNTGLVRFNTETLRDASLCRVTRPILRHLTHCALSAIRLKVIRNSRILCLRGVGDRHKLRVHSHPNRHVPLTVANVNGTLVLGQARRR